MKKLTKSDIIKMAKDEEVSYIRLQFSDILGNIKAVEISVSSLEDALDNKIIFDGSSVEGFVRIKEADMSLHPDYDTWKILSFEDSSYGKVARLICDVYNTDRKPFVGDPRYILKKEIEKAQIFFRIKLPKAEIQQSTTAHSIVRVKAYSHYAMQGEANR